MLAHFTSIHGECVNSARGALNVCILHATSFCAKRKQTHTHTQYIHMAVCYQYIFSVYLFSHWLVAPVTIFATSPRSIFSFVKRKHQYIFLIKFLIFSLLFFYPLLFCFHYSGMKITEWESSINYEANTWFTNLKRLLESEKAQSMCTFLHNDSVQKVHRIRLIVQR